MLIPRCHKHRNLSSRNFVFTQSESTCRPPHTASYSLGTLFEWRFNRKSSLLFSPKQQNGEIDIAKDYLSQRVNLFLGNPVLDPSTAFFRRKFYSAISWKKFMSWFKKNSINWD
ncbi:hypothetical protein KIN20_005379 [Parelaphostrongylus tenuis]|uniref:Uncharacterized protein n=1 Tax=Parelaphostrongylus tenuis TaxID=148309 RepID=A0AAD5MSP0_PARTN|nr:hypothetical protein KIN20_005379 [Parelaphostrongylus tenuis]